MKHRLATTVAVLVSLAAAFCALATTGSGVLATVRKDAVQVRAKMSLQSTGPLLAKGESVTVRSQHDLWYEVRTSSGGGGYVRLNEITLPPYKIETGQDSLNAATEGRAGAGRIAETASVRGVGESALKAGAYNETALRALLGFQVDSATASAYARTKHLQQRSIPRPQIGRRDDWTVAETTPTAGMTAPATTRNPLLKFGRELKSEFQDAFGPLAPQEEERLRTKETPLGLSIAGRLLGNARLSSDRLAMRRVNLVGRWVADQSPRPDLPWTFGILDVDEVNAFSTPGGFVFITRPMYDQLQSDDELAAVLGHEVSHVVARDLFRVIQKQKWFTLVGTVALGKIGLGGSSSSLLHAASAYAAINGGQTILARFDQQVEFRADRDALLLVTRAGYSPMAMYGLMQQLIAFNTRSTAITQLLKSHPTPEQRLDALEKTSMPQLQDDPQQPYTH